MFIKSLYAKQILDSRGETAFEADIYLKMIISDPTSDTSSAFTGSYETLELWDNDL